MTATPPPQDPGRWDQPEFRRLGVGRVTVEPGYTRFRVERVADADELLHRSAVTLAADIGALAAVIARVDPQTEQPNGTAELHLSFTGPLPPIVDVDPRVTHWAPYSAHLTIEARSESGELVATGVTTYSLRPRRPGGA